MKRKILFCVLSIPLILSLGLCSGPANASSDIESSRDLMSYYIDLIESGNYESAVGLWQSSSLARATRLGIEYDNIHIKPDCGSPAVYDLARMNGLFNHGLQSSAVIDSGVIRWKFSARIGSQKTEHFYYVARVQDFSWLITSQDYYAREWPIEESRYFRFHINPDRATHFNSIAAESLDEFVENVAEKISISSERLNLLSEMKIDYYLCDGEDEVERFSGKRESGVYEPASDAIISYIIPHYHEVAHLLINFRLQRLPLFTIPLIQKGLATYLGGRWQRSPGIVFDFGKYILKYNVVEIDSILTFNDFAHPEGGDIIIPVSACLIEYLYTVLGEEKFFQLYIALSGDLEFVTAISSDEVKAKITESFGQGWPELKNDFVQFVNSSGPHHGLLRPGDIETDKIIINENGLKISTSDKWLKIEYQTSKGVTPDINILFDRVTPMENKTSMLFNEQYRDKEKYDGYRYGIRLDRNEIGLYDYATNRIKAKFIEDAGARTDYYDSTLNKVTAYFDIDLVEGSLPEKEDYLILR